MSGAVWARTDEASRGDVVGSRSPRAIACALRHAIGFRKRGIEGRHRIRLYIDQDAKRDLQVAKSAGHAPSTGGDLSVRLKRPHVRTTTVVCYIR